MPVSNKKNDTSVKKPAEAKEKVPVVAVDEEKEALKKQLEELQAQMKMMAEMVASSNKTDVAVSEPKKDRYITFVNMTTGSVVLKGNNVYQIEGQFNKRRFLEREARIIVNNMKNAIELGYVYIADADFVRECELEDTYSTLLDDNTLKELLKHDSGYVVETYKNVADGQKQIIVNMLEEKKVNGEFVDANVLIEIGKLAHRDLINIEPEE